MSTRSILSSAVVAAATLTASVALASSHPGGGFSGGTSRSGTSARSGIAPARTGTGFNRFRPGVSGNFRNFRDNRFRHRHFDDDFFFFGFGDPFFYPFGYGYYPYGYYPYAYPPYGYPGGYGYGAAGYGSGYETSVSAVVNIQRRLARAGYYHGRIDGVMGPRTREAMRAYQRSHGARVSQR